MSKDSDLAAGKEVTETVQYLSIASLVPCPTNPRGEDLGNLDDIAASIKASGIHQPLIVRPADENGIHMIAFGHRRFAAAKLAELEVVPAVVRHYSDQQLLEAQIIENYARKDLDEISEARAFQRLVEEFGYSQRQVASRIGCTQAHVSRRLALLKLEPKALKALAEGKITIAQAVELTKLNVLPDERRKKAINEFLRADYNQSWLVQTKLTAWEAEQRRETIAAELEAEGVAYLAQVDQWRTNERYLTQPNWGNGLGLTPEEHHDEACHAATLHAERKIYVCLDYTRHLPDGASSLKLSEEEIERYKAAEQRTQESAERAEKEKAFEDSHLPRARHLQMMLKDRVPANEALDRLVGTLLAGASHYGLASLVCGYLEVAPLETPNGEDFKGALRAWISEGGAGASSRTAKVALAWALADIESDLRHPWNLDAEAALAHYAYLEAHGFQPSEAERFFLQGLVPDDEDEPEGPDDPEPEDPGSGGLTAAGQEQGEPLIEVLEGAEA